MNYNAPDIKVHGDKMGPTWVLSAQGGSHLDPVDIAIWGTNVTTASSLRRVTILYSDPISFHLSSSHYTSTVV